MFNDRQSNSFDLHLKLAQLTLGRELLELEGKLPVRCSARLEDCNYLTRHKIALLVQLNLKLNHSQSEAKLNNGEIIEICCPFTNWDAAIVKVASKSVRTTLQQRGFGVDLWLLRPTVQQCGCVYFFVRQNPSWRQRMQAFIRAL